MTKHHGASEAGHKLTSRIGLPRGRADVGHMKLFCGRAVVDVGRLLTYSQSLVNEQTVFKTTSNYDVGSINLSRRTDVVWTLYC